MSQDDIVAVIAGRMWSHVVQESTVLGQEFNQYDRSEWERILSGGDVLKLRASNAGRGRVAVVRAVMADGHSYIIKCWSRIAVRALVAKALGNSSGRNDYKASKKMSKLIGRCPAVVGYREVRTGFCSYDEILILEDLGDCRSSIDVIKELLRADSRSLYSFEEEVIRQTWLMLDNGLVDTDHRLNNFIVAADGVPVRIDFEHCKKYMNPYAHKNSVGKMLGVLIGSHVFATQPNVYHTEEFCDRLFEKLCVNKEIVRASLGVVDEMLAKQENDRGIVVKFKYGRNNK